MVSVCGSVVILCNLVVFAHAYTTFQPNCTAPSTSVNFVSSNETRGTIDILWSCLFTIIACTWTIQHLNVPEQREDRDIGWWGDTKWGLKRAWTSSKWMVATVFAPEILIAKNCGDLSVIKHEFEKLSRLAKMDNVPWSRTHSLLANMGGFVIRWNVPERLGHLNEVEDYYPSPYPARSPNRIPETQSTDNIFEFGSNDLQLQPLSNEENSHQSQDAESRSARLPFKYSNPYHLLASDLVALREAGFLPRLPFITAAEIDDKSKSDRLVRAVAIVQIIWMITQIIARAYQHLAVSQLEIAVAAFSICAILIYGLNWEKPKGVQTPYTVLQYRGLIPEEVLQTIGKGLGRDKNDFDGPFLPGIFNIVKYIVTIGYVDPVAKDLVPGSAIPNHFTPEELGSEDPLSRTDILQLAAVCSGGIVFGAVHVTAWDFVFPTLTEKKLWWAASVTCTVCPLFAFLAMIFLSYMATTSNYILDTIHKTIVVFFVLLCPLYTIARLFLLVEIIRTLYFLPPSAYIATWAVNVPHIA